MTGHKVVISGISGRFPNASNFVEFQNNLLNGLDCTTVEHNRWNQDSADFPKRMGIIDKISKFDRVFFGIHPKLTYIMDPTLKLLLETVFEAVMDAGINPRSLKGHNVSVYTATNLSESEKLIFHRKVQADGFGIVGASKAMIPNRISFFLGLHGSSINIDGADAGGASALERAYLDIKNGQAEAAIVGSSILNLGPHVTYQLRKMGVLSEDGYTRCFDDKANGCTRSDGIAVFFLQRENDAKRIYQEVVNIRSMHLHTYQNGLIWNTKAEPQAELLKATLRESNLTPDDISFVEASGTSIKSADEEELNAIDEVFRNRKKPLLIGSVRSNIGNTIPVNVHNSILKMIVASETETIPPNLHFERPNSKALGLVEGRLKVVTDLTPFEGPYSLVNVTSIVGNTGCIILKAPNIPKKNEGIPDDDIPRLAIASGRTEEAVESILEFLEDRPVDAEFLQLLYSIFQTDLSGHLFRGFTILPAKGLPNVEEKKKEVLFKSGENREVWWIFSGMGSQWPGMGEALLRLPVFAAAIKKCDAVLKPLGYDIYKILTDKDKTTFDAIINSFVGIAAVQIGLVDVLKSVGLEPDFIIGHSVGELGCAYADGSFSAEQMIMAALSRGLASTETKLERGSMAAVGLGYEQVKSLCPPDIDVACHNGPESSTISGPAESMKKFVADLTARGIFAREVACSNIAYHSRYIAPAGPKLLERLQKVIPNPVPRSSKWVSSSVPQAEWNSLKARLCSAEYHTNNLLSAVLFEETSRLIPPNAICIEIAPHGLLQAIVKRSLPSSCVNIALTRRGHPDNLEVLLNALGKMYNNGLQPQIENLYPKVPYPVGAGTASISSLIKWDHTAEWQNISQQVQNDVKEGTMIHPIDLNKESYKHLSRNVVDGKVSVPLATCLVLALDVLKSLNADHEEDFIFEDIKTHKRLITIPDNNIIILSVTVSKATGNFEILEESSSGLLVSGSLKETQSANQDRLNIRPKQITGGAAFDINQNDFYTELEMRGFQYSEEYKNVLKSTIDGNHGLIRWHNWLKFIDSALQLYTFGNDSRQVDVPFLIRKIVIDTKKQELHTTKSKEVQAFVDRELNYLSAGGLEIQGLKFSVIAKNWEECKLTNDVQSIQLLHDKTSTSVVTALRIILQLMIENTFSTKLQQINLIEKTKSEKFNTISDIMKDIPESTLFKISSTSYNDATFNKMLNVVIDDIKNYDVPKLCKKLNDNKFLLIFISTAQENSYIASIESAGLRVVFMRRLENETILLLRKKQTFSNVNVLNASNNVKDIVGKINTIKLTRSERVIVLVKGKDQLNLSELLDHIGNSADLSSIRIFNSHVPNMSDNDEIYKKQLELDLLVNILTSEKVWATLRQTANSLNPRNSEIFTVNQRHAHNPASIAWTDGPLLENKPNIVKVEYSALNSQDILIANGRFYSDLSEIIGKNRLTPMTIGLEFSGTDAKGNKVMGVSCGNSTSSFVSADEVWTWPVPKSWTLEDAATVPLSYILAYSALVSKAEIQAGERVMITNCCSGVGLAALHIATKQKCDIFATFETETEKKLLKSISPNFTEQRLFKMSEEEIRDQVLLQTNGKGVDVVICNETEIKAVEVLFTMCRRNARVVLISNLNENELYNSIGMEVFLNEMNFFSVVPKKVLSCDAETKSSIKNLIKEGIGNGTVTPLVRTVYRRELLNDAFNACLTNKHIGKILVKVQAEGSNKSSAPALPRLQCSQKKSYLLIEGLTNFGLELTDWLIIRGARNIVIASSSKNDSGFKKLRFQLWKSYGVQIVERQGIDLSQSQNIKSLFKDASSLGPVDAVFDLRRTDTASKSPSASLNTTTKIADEVSRSLSPELRFFVVFSAVVNRGTLLTSKKLGPVDRTSNEQDQAAVEIVENRKKNGLSGLVIRCGLKDSVREYTNDIYEIVLPPVTKYIQKLDEILGASESVVEISYVTPVSTKIEEDILEEGTYANMDPLKKESEEFRALISSDTTHIDNAIMSKA